MVRAGTEYFTVSQYQFKVSDESNAYECYAAVIVVGFEQVFTHCFG